MAETFAHGRVRCSLRRSQQNTLATSKMHKAAIILLETLSFFIIATECTDFENWMQNVTVVHLVSMNHLDVGFNHGEYTDHGSTVPNLNYIRRCVFSSSLHSNVWICLQCD